MKALLSSSAPLPSLESGFGGGGGGGGVGRDGGGRGSISTASSSPFTLSPSSRSRGGDEGGAGRFRGGDESEAGRLRGGATPDGLSTPTAAKSAPQETQESLLRKLYKRYAFLRSEVRFRTMY